MDPALVSIIIPTYNAEPWIAETLESAFQQTYSNTEIIVVDDGSTDQTRTILQSYVPRIRLILNETNQGVAASRNRGNAEAKGQYVALLDHDDLWEKDKLAKQMALFEATPTLGLVFSDCLYRTQEGKTWRSFQVNAPSRGNVFNALLENNFVPCLTAVIPRNVLNQIGVFRKDFQMAEDLELFLRIAQRYPIDYVDKPLGTHRIHSQNFSRKLDIYYSEWITTLSLFSPETPRPGDMAFAYFRLGNVRWGKKEFRLAVQSWGHGFWLAIFHPGSFLKTLRAAWNQHQRLH